MTFPTGAWEYCGFQVQLDRVRTKYIAGFYIPSFFFVILSWLSFIIKPDAIPGRMMLLLNIFLIMVLLMNSVKESAPDSNNFNAIDIYLAVSTIHVFGAILEYAIVLYVMKKFDLEWKKNQDVNTSVPTKDNKVHVKATVQEKTMDKITISRSRSNWTALNLSTALFYNLDWISLFIFPLSFVIFNTYYCSHYKVI